MEKPVFKILTLGEASVGKTNLIKRFCGEKFSEKYMLTLGVDWKDKDDVVIDGHNLVLNIWDTAGQENYCVLPASYYRNADGCIIVFDITNMKSFERVSAWCETIVNNCGAEDGKVMNCILIGNKMDLAAERVVHDHHISQLVSSLAHMNVQYFPTSAKTGMGVNDAFLGLGKKILHRKLQEGTLRSQRAHQEEMVQTGSRVDFRQQQQAGAGEKKKGCC